MPMQQGRFHEESDDNITGQGSHTSPAEESRSPENIENFSASSRGLEMSPYGRAGPVMQAHPVEPDEG